MGKSAVKLCWSSSNEDLSVSFIILKPKAFFCFHILQLKFREHLDRGCVVLIQEQIKLSFLN